MEQTNYVLVPNKKENNMKYSWALNASKLQRAEAMAPGQDEQAIKAAYIKLGGKVGESELPSISEVTGEKIDPSGIPEGEITQGNVETTVVAPKAKKAKPAK